MERSSGPVFVFGCPKNHIEDVWRERGNQALFGVCHLPKVAMTHISEHTIILIPFQVVHKT
jgi:hypothetical protein